MNPSARKIIALVLVLIFCAGALPLLLYWVAVGNVPAITARAAVKMLDDPNAILVDVRAPAAYRASHIDGAENWDWRNAARENIPAPFKDKRVLLICESGIESAFAARALNALGVAKVWSVEGGMQSWFANAHHFGSARFASLRLATGEMMRLPFRDSSPGEQFVAVLAGYGVKTIYMLIAFALVVVLLWRQKSRDLAVLGWGMVAFFAGEAICWINFPIFNEESAFLEYLHSYGMVVAVAFIVFALIEGLDQRVIGFSDANAKCALLNLCRGCVKYKPVSCGLQRTFKLAIVALIAVAVMPLNAEPLAIVYTTRVLNIPVIYTHPIILQLYEIRVIPALAMFFFTLAFAILQLGAPRHLILSKIFFAAGMGHLVFGFLRLMLSAFYRDNHVWFEFWEEATELILIAGIAIVLWIFRAGLELKIPIRDDAN
ncbi:MAG: rhodanese-like domain-containing protein [Chloroflexi bacterium]|nr:rhodanese-like domain-containing protein [Chloroflexota bacterium]